MDTKFFSFVRYMHQAYDFLTYGPADIRDREGIDMMLKECAKLFVLGCEGPLQESLDVVVTLLEQAGFPAWCDTRYPRPEP